MRQTKFQGVVGKPQSPPHLMSGGPTHDQGPGLGQREAQRNPGLPYRPAAASTDPWAGTWLGAGQRGAGAAALDHFSDLLSLSLPTQRGGSRAPMAEKRPPFPWDG